MKKYSIFKVYHDQKLLQSFPCPEDRIYYDTSQNEWGKYFCEGLIFFDDNLDIDAEYIGLEHYCRQFKNFNQNTADKYLQKINNKSCYVYVHVDNNRRDEKIGYYSSTIFNWKELDAILFNYLKDNKLYKELYIAIKPYLTIHRTMFILRREEFIEMREFVRNLTKHFLKELNIQKPSDVNNIVENWKPEISVFRGKHRLLAFLIEHFVAIWISSHISTIHVFSQILDNGYKEWRYDETNLDIHVVDQCNLNCKYCSHLAPFASNNFLDVSKFEKDLQSIPEFVRNKFKYIYLLGGEPLLHPQIIDIVNISKKYFPSKDIRLLTNGLLLPKMGEDFYKCLVENNIFLDVTQYPIKFNYSIIKSLQDKGINILTHKVINTPTLGFWRQQLDPYGNQDYNYQYQFCVNHRTKNCFQLDGTLLRICPTEKHVHFLNDYFDVKFKNYNKDVIDLSKITNIKQLEDWYYTPKNFCSQCVNDKWKPEPYGISERKIEEYV